MPKLKNRFLRPTEHLRNLQLLEEISKDSDVSQRKLAHRLGAALGLTNACLKKMIAKGLVKVKGELCLLAIGYNLKKLQKALETVSFMGFPFLFLVSLSLRALIRRKSPAIIVDLPQTHRIAA